MFCGPKFGMLRSVLASVLLANFDYSVPATVGIGGNGTFASAFATDEWFDFSTGTVPNNVGSETLGNDSGLTNRNTVNLWNGTDFTTRKGWESRPTAGSDTLVASGSTAGDSNNADFAFTVIVRLNKAPGNFDYLLSKHNNSVGFKLGFVSGALRFTVEDSTAAVDLSKAAHAIDDGAWHRISGWYDESTDQTFLKADTFAEVSTSTAAAVNTFTNGAGLQISGFNGAASANGIPACQVAYMGVSVGSSAQDFYDETIDLPGVDPATQDAAKTELTTQSRASLISVPMSAVTVAHFADDTLPIGYNANFSDTNKLGLYCNSAVTNLLAFSEDFTNAAWVKTNMTVTPNDVDSPDGFRSADRLTATAANGTVAQLFTTVAATQYTISLPLREFTVGCTGRLILYDETGASELASQVFTADGTWGQYISVTATTNGGQISSSFRIEIDNNTEEINANFCQANLGAARGAYIRTSGSSAALVGSDYSATGNLVLETKGELASVVVPVIYGDGATAKTVFDSAAADQRTLSLGTTNFRMACVIRNNAAGIEFNNTPVATFASGTLTRHRVVWDETSPFVDGFKAVLYDVGNDVQTDGASGPWSGASGGGYLSEFFIGQHSSAGRQLDGFVQSIKSYDGQNGTFA